MIDQPIKSKTSAVGCMLTFNTYLLKGIVFFISAIASLAIGSERGVIEDRIYYSQDLINLDTYNEGEFIGTSLFWYHGEEGYEQISAPEFSDRFTKSDMKTYFECPLSKLNNVWGL